MKKIWIATLAIVMISITLIGLVGCDSGDTTLSEGSIVVNTNSQQTGLWVNGEGKVYATPDLAILVIGVEAQAKTVAEANTQAADAMDALIKALKEAGLEDKDIQTSSFSIYPVREWNQDTGEETLVGFRVTNTVNAKIREIDGTGAIIDAVVNVSGNYTRIQGVNFTVEDPTAYFDQARSKAVNDAKRRAQQLATQSGVKLGKLVYLTETSGYLPPVRYAAYDKALAESNGGTSISAGELEINMNVQANFEIEQ